MWHRNEARPVMYNGITFRSALEAKVAEELDGFTDISMKTEWEYERRTPFTKHYLPDFTIISADESLLLPQWVEVKPSSLLYAVRDHFGVPERFEGEIHVPCAAKDLVQANLTEVPKPKRLAEVSGERVLVVSAINRNRTLSLMMLPDRITFSRSHPTVNRKGFLRERERAEQEREWRERYEDQQRRRAEEEERQRSNNLAWARSVSSRPAKFDGVCIVCFQLREARALRITNHDGRWIAFCEAHLNRGDA